ncbi:MAG: hypothetical protein HY430_03795 [Candidatus Levybacteria bacterium]|nr:hypothetical protein [Candidatus Levybacteria bacterium]
MKFLQLKIFRILSLAVIVALILTQTDVLSTFLRPREAYAVGDLSVNWGIGSGNVGPIFEIDNMAPGDSESRDVMITNNASVGRPLGVRGIRTDDGSSILPEKLLIVISEGGSDVYGGTTGEKTLANFFNDSTEPTFIEFFTISPGDTRTLTISVEFDEDAGNDFQNLSVVFDIRIGIAFDLPEACEGMTFKGNPIFGTEGNDKIKGTNNNDLILGLEGNDELDGSNGDDCIIGGDGNDKLSGGNGNDIVEGGLGSDSAKGGNGNDLLSGGIGSDTLDGGNENDELYGGEGTDRMEGGNGKDKLFGGSGSDSLDGGNGNDELTGEDGSDSANGRNGTDTCVAETKISCEI